LRCSWLLQPYFRRAVAPVSDLSIGISFSGLNMHQGAGGTQITELVLTPEYTLEPGTLMLVGWLIAGLVGRRRLSPNA
jgi:hypothetical protein